MLYNVNVILYKLLSKKQLLSELYKDLIHRFYLTGQFMPWTLTKIRKKSLGFAVIGIGTCMSLTQN